MRPRPRTFAVCTIVNITRNNKGKSACHDFVSKQSLDFDINVERRGVRKSYWRAKCYYCCSYFASYLIVINE